MKTQYLLFDLDDTLIHCNSQFNTILIQFIDYMMIKFSVYSPDLFEIKHYQQSIHIEGIKKQGLKAECFPNSLLKTYYNFCQKYGEKHLDFDENFLFKLGFSVYDQPVELFQNVDITLHKLLQKDCKLFLYTGGDYKIQKKKIEKAGLYNYFPEDHICVTEYKNSISLKEAIDNWNLKPEITWMIGNSLKTDILPALQIGLKAIYIPLEDDWIFHKTEIPHGFNSSLFRAKNLLNIPSIIFAPI